MNDISETATSIPPTCLPSRAEGPWSDLALHSIGWKAFQDLCSQVCEVVLHRPVEIFREAQDDGQDAVFLLPARAGGPANVGTVQCKHSSDHSKQLRLADLTAEVEHIKALIKDEQAHTYILMTSMSVSASVASAIRNRLKALGVQKPHVFGKQFLVRSIRSSPRLRALVPQVYGLGDLSTILDQRFLQQTRALLDQWIPKLKVYVPTEAHRQAVRALTEHGVVLLLGHPSSGKSAIGAILSTIASEDMRHTVLSPASPREFEAGWNPNDPSRFFWIDDAFGANVLREDYVQDWTTAFRKVQAAISHGNKFLLTSRDYIYEAAKQRLGSRNLQVFVNNNAVVDVGKLTKEEKAQILYNHIHFGNQTQSWKRSVKEYLSAVSEVNEFLPGIAERLADPAFTKGLAITGKELIRFMREPRGHLIDTINALDDRLRAGLILVYVHQGMLREQSMDQLAAKTVSDLSSVPLTRVLESLRDLKGSFLRSKETTYGDSWEFAHPTISDALTQILQERPHMMAALLRGATVEAIIGNFVCEGMPAIRNAPIVPTTLDDILVERLLRIPDEVTTNEAFFRFLADRASDQVVQRVVASDPEILDRRHWAWYKISRDAKIALHARALRLGVLDENRRLESADRLEAAASEEFDLSFLEDEDVVAIIPPKRLIALGIRLQTNILPSAEDKISDAADNADLDCDPESYFEDFSNSLDALEGLSIVDESTEKLIEMARGAITIAVEKLTERKNEKDSEYKKDKKDLDKNWQYISSVPETRPVSLPIFGPASRRSLFDDVDR